MTNDQLPEILGKVNYLDPLNGLEHVNVIPRDVVILSTPQAGDESDDLSWPELVQIVRTNDLSALKRRPHDLRNYLRWKHYVEKTRTRGGVLEYLLSERLHWLNTTDSDGVSVVPPVDSRFMGCAKEDLKILRNDFPYAMRPGIVHVVVWTRTKIPLQESGDITPYARTLIERYVNETFVENPRLDIDRESVIWFKNWAALQSIPALEHFHVLLRNPNVKELERLYNTGGVQISLDE